ncbi:MAG TPA: ABC transporter substrate-binding protein, partial [Prosthecobacter sp.]|nr:ABC transporter substrate-binding protein [Prosthecobacter sp.]
ALRLAFSRGTTAERSRGDAPHAGAGAWRVARRDERSLLLERRDWESGALPQRLRFFPAQPAHSTRLTLAARGIDIIWPNESGMSAPPPWVEKRPLPSAGQLLLLWNARSPRVADPGLRAALDRMLDRSALAEKNTAQVSDSFFPEGMWFTPPARQRPPEPGAAEQLRNLGWLQDLEGVWKKNGVPLEFTLLAPEDNAPRLALAQAMALQWLDAGARASIETLPQNSIIGERLATCRFDAVMLGRLNEPGYDMSAWWHSGGRLNYSGLADARLDLLLEALASEFDLTRVPARALAVEERLRELHIALPLLADAPHAAVSRARFAGRPGSTLRELLSPAAPLPPNLKMLEPKE